MSSFIRLAGAAAVVLSLGFLVAASVDVNVPAITGKDAVSLVCAKVFVDLEAKIKALREFAISFLVAVRAKLTGDYSGMLDHSRGAGCYQGPGRRLAGLFRRIVEGWRWRCGCCRGQGEHCRLRYGNHHCEYDLIYRDLCKLILDVPAQLAPRQSLD